MSDQPEPNSFPAPHVEGDSATPTTGDAMQLSRRQAIGRTVAGAAGLIAISRPGTAAAGPIGNFIRGRRTARARRKTGQTALKQIAMSNYHRSLAAYGGRLTKSAHHLYQRQRPDSAFEFDVLVIGSGYGGSICAARLAAQLAPGKRLAILERGKEWIPGQFPDRFRDVLREQRLTIRKRRARGMRNPLGLFNFVKAEEVDVISGSGLGGTSLINANVMVRPDADTFYHPRWPVALRDPSALAPYFDLAAMELGGQLRTIDASYKMRAHRHAGSRMRSSGKRYEPAMLAAKLFGPDGYNQHGMWQPKCIGCGDCMSGCNTGAKSTLQMNYLPMAKAAGAEIYSQVEVKRIEKCEGFYRLHLNHHHATPGGVQTRYLTTTARVVIVAGGSVGSTEMLLNSQSSNFRFSDQLGYHWSGNGDTLGFITKTQGFTNSAGTGTYPSGKPPVGLSIESILRLHEGENEGNRILIEDGNMPRAYANVVGTLMRDIDLKNVMVLFGMGHDGSAGRIRMQNGLPTIDWPGAKTSEYRRYMRSHFERIATAYGGRYKYLRAFGANLITVHPLGGCNMSDDPLYGVVNDMGNVYDGASLGYANEHGAAMTHEGLYVVDGSIVPGSLGANPMLTIAALAERTARNIAFDPALADLFA